MERYSFLKEVDSLALANAKLHLKTSYKNFFSRRAKFPMFKVKGRDDSYTTNNQKGNICISGKYIKLPKIGFVKVKQHRLILEGEIIKSCTISRKAGKYYIAVLVEYEEEPIIKIPVSKAVSSAIGLDYSVPDFYVDSDGRMPKFLKAYWKSQKTLAKLQRRFSRKQKGSKNYRKARQEVQKLCQKVSNQRLDFCHKESRRLVDQYDVICMEDINLRTMSRTLRLGKSVMDGGFGMFWQFLQYKMDRKGGYVVYIDKWYPSSKTCHCCGYINKLLQLSDRECIGHGATSIAGCTTLPTARIYVCGASSIAGCT